MRLLGMVIRYISMKFQPSVLYGSIFSITVIFFTRIADLINMDSQCIKTEQSSVRIHFEVIYTWTIIPSHWEMRSKKARTESKLTQEQIADMLDIDSRTISQIERGLGNPKLETLYPLIRILNVDANTIFYSAPRLKHPIWIA